MSFLSNSDTLIGILLGPFNLLESNEDMTFSQGSTISVHSVCTYAWATGTYAWLISCVLSTYALSV